jgi:hypothetical protein
MWALRKEGVNENLVDAVMRLYGGVRTKVRLGNGLSEVLEVKVGCTRAMCCPRGGYERTARRLRGATNTISTDLLRLRTKLFTLAHLSVLSISAEQDCWLAAGKT